MGSSKKGPLTQVGHIGLQDVSINALWSKEDNRDVSDEFYEIREHYLNPDSFEKKLDRKFNDQTVHFERSGRLFDPLVVTDKKYDLVTLSGMSAITEWLTGKRTESFTHYASGTGTSEESASDIRLEHEHYRVSLITDGYAEPSGAAAKFAGKFPYTAPTATISEGGVFSRQVGGTMLFRTVFPTNERISHTQYSTFFTLTQSISMISIT